jgi:hypothetical protein
VLQDTKQIEVLYYTHYNKLYHNVQKCYILYPNLKPESADIKKPKRSRAKTGNKSDSSVSLIAHFGMTVTSDTNSLLHIQWIVDTVYSCYITHTREHFISYTLIVQSAAVVKGLGGVSVTLIKKGTV